MTSCASEAAKVQWRSSCPFGDGRRRAVERPLSPLDRIRFKFTTIINRTYIRIYYIYDCVIYTDQPSEFGLQCFVWKPCSVTVCVFPSLLYLSCMRLLKFVSRDSISVHGHVSNASALVTNTCVRITPENSALRRRRTVATQVKTENRSGNAHLLF